MAFDQSTILEVYPPRRYRGQVHLSWSSSSPADTYFQAYVNGELVWAGRERSCTIPVPSGPLRVDIGTPVSGFGEEAFGARQFDSPWGLEATSYAASLPAAPARRARLQWLGGIYAGLTLAGFRVYGEATPGGGIDYATPLTTMTANPGGIATDGFGLGGFGTGGMGRVAGTYSWTSEPLAAGTWQFAVKPFDAAGNEGTASISTVTIAAPPRAPTAYADGSRIGYTLSGFGLGGFGGGPAFGAGNYGSGSFGGGTAFGSAVATITWQATST